MLGTRVSALAGVLALMMASVAAAAPQKCGQDVAIANGPFAYTASDPDSATFLGSAGDPHVAKFTVTAPNATGETVVFPGQGQNPCVGLADATIGVFEITKVSDAEGNLLESPVSVDSASALYSQIASAFSFSPAAAQFVPGSSVVVDVTIANPAVSDADYGQYVVKMAAQAPGAGIGVGPGALYTLTLSGESLTDTTPPTVTVSKPNGDQILGVIPVEVSAVDPEPGSGVASLSATVSSAGGTVSNLPITLALDQTLPIAAGVPVTGTGSFTPTGGTGPSGTTDALAFTSASRSGIGSYTLNAQATDVAGNLGSGSRTFAVKYAVAFTQQFTQPPCASSTGNAGKGCSLMLSFTANRSNATSDGAFMFDHTVVVELVRVSDNHVMASHSFGTGSILSQVQIDAAGPSYKTHFKRSDLGVTVPGTYVAKIYFLDVDNHLALEGTSDQVTF